MSGEKKTVELSEEELAKFQVWRGQEKAKENKIKAQSFAQELLAKLVSAPFTLAQVAELFSKDGVADLLSVQLEPLEQAKEEKERRSIEPKDLEALFVNVETYPELTCDELSKKIGDDSMRTYTMLQKLIAAGKVEVVKQGRKNHYRATAKKQEQPSQEQQSATA